MHGSSLKPELTLFFPRSTGKSSPEDSGLLGGGGLPSSFLGEEHPDTTFHVVLPQWGFRTGGVYELALALACNF